jgi:O-antigen/teichoic acid export membrane protein
LGPALAHFIAGGRHTVFVFLVIGFALTPLTLGLNLLNAVNWAREGWRTWLIVRLIPPIGTLLITVGLFLLGRLTVASASATALTLSLLAGLPLITILPSIERPRFRRRVATQGMRFGFRAWIGSLANVTNARLDQLLMTRIVSSQQLGFYAVGVNATVFQSNISSSILSSVFPRVAAGDIGLARRATRATILLVALACSVAIVAVGFVLPLLFGASFRASVPMARILLVSGPFYAASAVLQGILVARGHPGLSARAEVISVGVTVPGLLLLLPVLGGEGAALVSVIAYTTTFAYALRKTVRVVGGRYRDYLVPHRGDWHFLWNSPIAQALRTHWRRRLPQRAPLN